MSLTEIKNKRIEQLSKLSNKYIGTNIGGQVGDSKFDFVDGPTGSKILKIGTVDVVNEYDWSLSNKDAANAEVPTIELIEYQQTASGIERNINFWVNQVDEVLASENFRANPYEKLYTAKPTGNMYIFPYYSDYHHIISNSWGENRGANEAKANELITSVGKVVYPSAGLESPKSWQGTDAAQYTFSFDLINTTSNGINGIIKNRNLIKTLIYQNLQDRLNSVASFPPVLYSINIRGVRSSPAATIASLNVQNLGQLNRMQDPGLNGVLVPDAYRLNFQIEELITESRLIYEDATNGRVTASVINEDATISEGIRENLNKVRGIISDKINTSSATTTNGLADNPDYNNTY